MKQTPLDLTGSLRAKSSSLFAVSAANGDIDSRVSNAYGIYSTTLASWSAGPFGSTGSRSPLSSPT
jgi:hypothetical protein